MKSGDLQKMAALIGDDDLQDFFPDGRVPSLCAGGVEPKVARFILAYRDLSFGWKFAKWCADRGRRLPDFIFRNVPEVFRAWLYITNPRKFADEHLVQALALTTSEMHGENQLVRSLLVSRDTGLKEAARHLRWPVKTLQLYEALFFNVRDRIDDILYMRRVVFGNSSGRMADYLRKEFSMGDANSLMMRAGYENGAKELMFLAGAGDNPYDTLSSAEQAQRLEKTIMAVGIVQASAGFMNQGGRHAFTHARTLVQAGKLSGGDTTHESILAGSSSIGEAIAADLIDTRMREIKQAQARAAMDRMTGALIDMPA